MQDLLKLMDQYNGEGREAENAEEKADRERLEARELFVKLLTDVVEPTISRAAEQSRIKGFEISSKRRTDELAVSVRPAVSAAAPADWNNPKNQPGFKLTLLPGNVIELEMTVKKRDGSGPGPRRNTVQFDHVTEEAVIGYLSELVSNLVGK